MSPRFLILISLGPLTKHVNFLIFMILFSFLILSFYYGRVFCSTKSLFIYNNRIVAGIV